MPGLELDRRTLRLIAIAFVLLAALSVHRLFFTGLSSEPDVLIVRGQTMGTTYEIRIAGEALDTSLRRRVENETTHRLDQIDRWMSNWNPESEISRFNAHQNTSDFLVSNETADVIAFAIALNEASDGAFDITVGPLVARWGFGSDARIDGTPSKEEIAGLLSHMGAGVLRVGSHDASGGPFLGKNDPLLEIDLSAVAKVRAAGPGASRSRNPRTTVAESSPSSNCGTSRWRRLATTGFSTSRRESASPIRSTHARADPSRTDPPLRRSWQKPQQEPMPGQQR